MTTELRTNNLTQICFEYIWEFRQQLLYKKSLKNTQPSLQNLKNSDPLMSEVISTLHQELSKATQYYSKRPIKANRLMEIIALIKQHYLRANLIQKANLMNLIVIVYSNIFASYRKSLFKFKTSLYQPSAGQKKERRSKRNADQSQLPTVRKQRRNTQKGRNETTDKKLDLYQILDQQLSSQYNTEIQSTKKNQSQQLTLVKLNRPSQLVLQSQLEMTIEPQIENEDQIIQDFRANYNQIIENQPNQRLVQNLKNLIIPPEGASKQKQKRKTAQQKVESTKKKVNKRRREQKILIDTKISLTQGDAALIEIQIDQILSKTKSTKKVAHQIDSFYRYFDNILNEIVNPVSIIKENAKGIQYLKKMKKVELQNQFDDQQQFDAFISQHSLHSFGNKQGQNIFVSQKKYSPSIQDNLFFTPIKSQNYTATQRQVFNMIEEQLSQGRSFNVNQYMRETKMVGNQKANFFHKLMHLNINLAQEEPSHFSDLVIRPSIQ